MDKDPHFIIHSTNPLNAEPEPDKLRENFITPYKEFYIRNHGDIPEIDENIFRLQVNGLVEREMELSMKDLLEDFSKHSVMATLQCAGNRRTELLQVAPVPGEVPWHDSAIGNAVWTGVRLRDILIHSGVKNEARYIEFMGADEVFRHGENVGFGASIQIEKGLSDEVILAYEMNDSPLEPTHGFPLRAVVPGYIGARSVKWLTRITLLKEPSKNYFQDHAYRLFPPEAKAETVDWNTGIQLSELNVNCVITAPKNDSIINNGAVTAEGWAISGGKKIIRVEISIDNGVSWSNAKITDGDNPMTWSFWEAKLALPSGESEIIARAIDSEMNIQPAELREVWNFKGYMNNGWHRVKVGVKES
ncbi:MAG: molybdopterin-dependent oxidoreductase [Chitinophagales bacterium]